MTLCLAACGGGGDSTVAPSAIQGTVSSATFVTDSSLASATAVQNVACVANGACTLAVSADSTESSMGSNGLPMFQLRTTPSQTDIIFTSDYAQVAAGTFKVTLLATAGGSTIKRLFSGIVVQSDPSPVAPAGSGFANLVGMTRTDRSGVSAITPIDAGGVTDPNGRTLVYSATGLPVSPSVFAPGLTIDSATGQITGTYDANGPEVFTVTVTVTPAGSTKRITKTFQLTVNDNG